MNNLLKQSKIKNIHFIGIGGIGMSGLAEILFKKGYSVSGSDIAKNPMVEHLSQLGIPISIGHKKENIKNAEAIIYSSIITSDNPEFAAAQALGLPIIQRGKLLADIMQDYVSIAVAGTHGKTTTTGMAIHLFLENKMDPTFAVGGILKNFNSTSCIGKSKYFIAESDESDASYLFLSPHIALVTNVDADHLSTYQGSFERLKDSFKDFLKKVSANGAAILNKDDPTLKKIGAEITCPVITYGFDNTADIAASDYHAQGLQSRFTVKRKNSTPLAVKLNLPGMHNASNALAIIALAQHLKISDAVLLKALAEFPGMGRRFHAHGEIAVSNGKALIFDDYGHHPNEIKMTLQAAKQAWPNQRVVMVFQPHRYTRTRDLMDDFAEVLTQADLLILLSVYGAGEVPLAGINSEILCQKIESKGKINPILVPQMENLPQILKEVLQSGDIVLFQGAGSVGPMANTISKLEIFR